ncbi:hypothetical protein E4U60_006434 [Claviceps pazoutovae]|uniref:Uncharacterized protein n=1 Tax=Claviceps pazoutovae TaxID=1649127 RepID=A0A9P7MGL3_9HYPO|nr:hypothetical protein E4U60_006434 [Claviceps pazoutovae]
MPSINVKLAEVAPFDVALKCPRLIFHLERPKHTEQKSLPSLPMGKHQIFHPLDGLITKNPSKAPPGGVSGSSGRLLSP